MKRDWILAIGGSDEDGVTVFLYQGWTKDEMKQELVYTCESLREMYEEEPYSAPSGEYSGDYDFGTETVEDVQERDNGNLYAYICFEGLHIDVEATPMDELKGVSK